MNENDNNLLYNMKKFTKYIMPFIVKYIQTTEAEFYFIIINIIILQNLYKKYKLKQ